MSENIEKLHAGSLARHPSFYLLYFELDFNPISSFNRLIAQDKFDVKRIEMESGLHYDFLKYYHLLN